MTDKDVERVVAEAIWTAPLTGQPRGYEVRKWPPRDEDAMKETMAQARAAIAAHESAVPEIAKLGTVSLTSFDGHCVRIDFPSREDAERMYAVLTGAPGNG